MLSAKVLALATDKFAVGVVTDEDMRAVGLHEYFDPDTIVDTANLCLNRKRSM